MTLLRHAVQLHGMAQQGHAPKVFMKVSSRGIPWVTVVVMMFAMLIAVYLNYLMPEKVFLVIASLATFATVWVIAVNRRE